MYSFSASLFRSLLPHLAQCMAGRRAAWEARCSARRRQARFARPRIEYLEERLNLDAFTYVNPDTGQPGVGAWSDAQNWTDTSNAARNGTVPTSSDTADIPVGASCTLTSGASSENVSVEGTFTVQSTLNIEGNTNAGLGSLAIAGGTVTVGGPSGTSSGTIDTINLGMSPASGSGAAAVLNIGATGDGMGGLVDVSGTMSDGSGGTLTVGGAGGSSGLLDVQVLTAGATTIYANGGVDVKTSAAFLGFTTIAGGVIQADNINANTGATVTIGPGGATITNGPLSGNLTAEENASFTFTGGGPFTLGAGATLGDGQFFIESPIAVDTDLTVSNAEFTLEDNGSSTFGSIGGTGSIEWYNHPFTWEGGTIGGLTGGGFTIEGQADFVTSGAAAETLSTTLTNLGPSTVDFGGTGPLTITGTGALINEASSVVPMEISLPTVSGPGTLTNAGYLNIVMTGSGPSDVTISAPLDNTAGGVLDVEMGAGTLTLADTSGSSILDGSIGLNSNGLIISGIYTTDSALSLDNSGGTTLTDTLTIDSGGSADLDALTLSGKGTITGAGDVTLEGDCYCTGGTIGGSGSLTVGGAGTLYVTGSGTLDRDLDVEGTVQWESSGMTFGTGVVIDIEEPGYFNYEESHASLPALSNDGTLEIGTDDILALASFTQSSSGTLQIDIASDSPSGYGFLMVSGLATLDGTLKANLENGYQPPSGTSFDVLNFGSRSGEFATVDPQGWSADYGSTSMDLIAG